MRLHLVYYLDPNVGSGPFVEHTLFRAAYTALLASSDLFDLGTSDTGVIGYDWDMVGRTL